MVLGLVRRPMVLESKSKNADTRGPALGQFLDDRPRRVSRGGHYMSYSEGDRAGGNSLRIAYREAIFGTGLTHERFALCPSKYGGPPLVSCYCLDEFSELVLLGLVRALLLSLAMGFTMNTRWGNFPR